MAREFIVPGQMISGSGALDMAQDTLGTLGKKAMIVTDKSRECIKKPGCRIYYLL